MATNIEKFKASTASLNEQARQAFIAEFGAVPEYVWRIGGAGLNYDPEKWFVNYVSYRYAGAGEVGLWFAKRPSREQVSEIERVAAGPIELERVSLHVYQKNSSTACKPSDLSEAKTWSLSAEVSAARAQELRDIYIPKEGQFCCRYCGKATDEGAKITSTIIARQYPGMRKSFDYCSARCGSYDQMAHEG